MAACSSARGTSLEQRRGEHPQHRPAVRERHVGADPGADLDPHTELLGALAGQRLSFGLAGFDLAAGELPAARNLGRRGPLTGQNSPIYHDDGRDNHSR
jgi:hypothetical protein